MRPCMGNNVDSSPDRYIDIGAGMNTAEIIASAVVAAILALAVFLFIRTRKKGGCSGNCSACGQGALCGKHGKENGVK